MLGPVVLRGPIGMIWPISVCFWSLSGAFTAAAAGTIGFDVDADGTIDIMLAEEARNPDMDPPVGRLADRDEDGCLEIDLPGPIGGRSAESLPNIDFELVWDSGTILNTIWTVTVGDADRDQIFDFAGASFAPNVIHLFESTGDTYAEIWNSAANTPPGAYRDIAFADTDEDDLGEILGAEVSTLGKVMLFEQDGSGFAFVHDEIRESDFSGAQRLRSVLVGDTDLDGHKEVIVAAGGSSPTNGLVSIWEHSGAIGENTYERIYEYTTVSYLFQATLGDSDNDGYPEIILGLGGMGGNPLIIRRLEYDPALQTWVHTMYTSAVIGLPVTPHVADFDGDGEQELAYGSSGFVVIYEHTAENTYTPRFVSTEPLDGNILTLDDAILSVPTTPVLAAGSFEGDLALWAYDAGADSFDHIYGLEALGGALRGLALADDEGDGRHELLPAIAAPADQIRVYRRVGDPAGIPAPASPGQPVLRLAHNPVVHWAVFQVPAGVSGLALHDIHGRLVRFLDASAGQARWNGRDAAGRRVGPGRYFARAVNAGGVPCASLAVTVIR